MLTECYQYFLDQNNFNVELKLEKIFFGIVGWEIRYYYNMSKLKEGPIESA